MEKSKIFVICLAFIIIVATIVALLVADARDTTVLTIGKDKYDLNDYESYGKVWAYENNTALINSSDEMLSQYKSYKTFYRWAGKVGVTLDETEIPASLESGDAEKLLNDYELTEDEYMRVQTEMALANKLYSNAYALGKIPESTYDEYVNYLQLYPEAIKQNYNIESLGSYRVEDYLKTVYYRVFEIPLPQDSSEGESGEVSGDAQADKTQAILDAKLKAQELIAQAKEAISSGDSVEDAFAAIAQGDLASVSRYSLGSGSSLGQIPNGGLEVMARLYHVNGTKGSLAYLFGLESESLVNGIDNAILRLNKGEFSDIFETDDSVAFVYVEDITEGLEGSELESFQNDFSNYYISVNSDGVGNKGVARRFKPEKLPGVIAMREAEKASGDSINDPLSGVINESGEPTTSIEVVE